MDYKKQIDDHMKNKFENLEKIVNLDKLPDEQELDRMPDSKIFKVPFTCIFIDVVNFKKLSEHTDPKIVSCIMSEFTYGVTKIIKEFGGFRIQIQGDGIYGIFKSSTKDEIHEAFKCACALSTFQKHLNKNIERYFDGDIKYDRYSLSQSDESFSFGIGLYYSEENFISKVGHGSTRDLIFMGESVSKASVLAKTSNRNFFDRILMNELIKINFPDDSNPEKDNFSGFKKVFVRDLNEYVWSCNWVITTYNNFVDNNV